MLCDHLIDECDHVFLLQIDGGVSAAVREGLIAGE